MKGARILLLDDNREARWPLARVLRAAGAQVTEADDGSDGLKLLERGPFDVIIADVCMPRLGGFGLFSRLRFGDGMTDDELPYRDIPIILITGQVSRAELARGMDAGLDDFVPKPVDLDEFRSRVRAVVRRGRAAGRPRTRTRGELADLGILALAQALHLGCGSGRLCVRTGTAYCILDFQRGQISHASYAVHGYDVQGDEAALLVLAGKEGTFELEPVPDSSPRSVFSDTQSLLLRAATQADESFTAASASDDAAAVPQDDPEATQAAAEDGDGDDDAAVVSDDHAGLDVSGLSVDVDVTVAEPAETDSESQAVEFDLDDEPAPAVAS